MRYLSVVAPIMAAGIFLSAGPAYGQAMPDFGSPPSGQIPILFNDHHVYARPDVIRRDRVLAAIVRNGVLMVPLRSMFEQMGATVSFDASSKSVTAKSSGASVQVALGSDQAVINGESRPIDQPPIMFQGHLLVPVRVMSEALGAYVEWVPSQRVAVVRFKPPTPAPTLAPTLPPTPAPTPVPTPTPGYRAFIQGAAFLGRNYNEFASGQNCQRDSFRAEGAVLFNPWALKLDWQREGYLTADNATDALGNHLTQYHTPEGTVNVVPEFKAHQGTFDARLEYKLLDPHIYIGVGYVIASNSYAVPGYSTYHGPGIGVEKLPDFPQQFSIVGSFFYYPDAKGTYTEHNPADPNFGLSFEQKYNIYKYDIGFTYLISNTPVYLTAGFAGDRYSAVSNAPVDQTHAGPYLGAGIKF